jgi:hypothetical protein
MSPSLAPWLALPLTLLFALLLVPGAEGAGISGDYLEARTADVWTGPCFANGEMGLEGKEAILAWRVAEGGWDGVALAGLSVVAVVTTDATLGDPAEFSGAARSLLLVDERAAPAQRAALTAFARTMAGDLLGQVVEVETAPIRMDVDGAAGVGRLHAGEMAEIETRALGPHDRHCGNEIVYYPPLTAARAVPAATVAHAFRGGELGVTWSSPGKRSAFVGSFVR